MTPYEKLYNRKPSVSHFKVLGCLCYAKDLTISDKLQSRAKLCVMMGYSEVQKGYILYNMKNKVFCVNRDMSFREIEFPFKWNTSETPLFLRDMTHHLTEEPTELVHCTIQAPTRMSGRSRQPPIWMKDFITSNLAANYSIANYISYDSIAPKYQAFLTAFSKVTEPKTYVEASKDPRWVEAMKVEISAL
ncbi:uncharacterized protein LOC132061162 [Lycium ferocissimum]|uniref:uncharacterized protein LOC132061162 n=1 Tax=Lycium ferocissimum TaxID=112874 RepID=UPI00281502A4|nr:uncharacterized protein LOC132061162 [Lycium ferocissimum]